VQYTRNNGRKIISEEDTFLWLSKGDLKAEIEIETEAAQDQALHTKYYGKKMLKTEKDSTCRHRKEMGMQLDTKHWYEHVPKSVETTQGGKVSILWNRQVRTDRTIPNNKPDIIIRDEDMHTDRCSHLSR
jgi:hypothetical protein